MENTEKLGGVKFDQGKARFDLMPPGVLEGVAEVFTYGANKYGERNWEKGMKWGRLFGAAMRHAWAFWNGNELDPESKKHHLYHAIASLMMLAELYRFDSNGDDRGLGV
jgi:hypothetical protein